MTRGTVSQLRLRVRQVFFGFGFLQLARFENFFTIQALHKFAVFIMGNDLGASVRAGLNHEVLLSDGNIGRVVSNDGSTGRIVWNTLADISKGRLFLATITILVMRSDFDPVNYSRILKRFVKTLVSAGSFHRCAMGPSPG